MMQSRTLFRLGAVTAIAGGVLRAVDAVTVAQDPLLLSILYFVTDVFLMFGLTGWYAFRAKNLGWAGVAGYAASVVAILVIRTGSLFGPRGYMLGAAMFLTGLSLMSICSLLRREGDRTAPILWVCTLAAGIAALAVPMLATLAGVLFGLGFVAAGVELWRRPA